MGTIDCLNALVLAFLDLVQITILCLVKDSHRLTVAFMGLLRSVASLLVLRFLKLLSKFRFYSLAVNRGARHLMIALIFFALFETITVLLLIVLIGWRHSLVCIKIEGMQVIQVVRHKRRLLRTGVIHRNFSLIDENVLEVGLVIAEAAH